MDGPLFIWMEVASRTYLPYVSPTSPYISPTSPYISPTSPLHLPYISLYSPLQVHAQLGCDGLAPGRWAAAQGAQDGTAAAAAAATATLP